MPDLHIVGIAVFYAFKIHKYLRGIQLQALMQQRGYWNYTFQHLNGLCRALSFLS